MTAAQGGDIKHTANRAFCNIFLKFMLLLGLFVVNTAAMAAITVSLSAPGNNTVVVAPGSFSLTASTSVSQGAPITSVSFYAGTTLLGTVTAPPGPARPALPAAAAGTPSPLNTTAAATYTWNWSNVPMGIYSLTVVATDKQGVTATSAPVTVIADVSPMVSLTSPASGTIVTAPASFTLIADASAPLGSIGKVDFYNGTTLIGTATTAPYTLHWANVPYGTYNITAKATDNYGFSTTTAAITIISNQPPTATLTAPATNTILTAPATFVLSTNASDIDGSIAKVEYYNGTTLIGTSTTSPYTYSWSNVAAGSFNITAVATDNYGAATTSAAVAVISNAQPAVSLTSPPNNAVSAAPGSFALSANATDSDGTVAKVDFYSGASLIGTATAAPYSFNWNNVPAGNYSLTAVVTDNLGISNTSTPVAVTVNIDVAQVYYIHTDHLNTPREITDTGGAVVWQWDNSDPFGNNAPNDNPSGQGAFNFNLRFAGQYFDRETNTHYNINRDYDPATGRYIESDPIGLEGGINTYAYVEGNPLSLIDPEGLMGRGSGLVGGVPPKPQSPQIPTGPRYPGSSCGPEGDPNNYPNKFSGQSIEGACQNHDKCYSDCTKSKSQCDTNFYKDIRRACINGGSAIACNLASIGYYEAVSLGGNDPFNQSRGQCQCSSK